MILEVSPGRRCKRTNGVLPIKDSMVGKTWVDFIALLMILRRGVSKTLKFWLEFYHP
jgi:hypothetical protein